MDSLSKPTTNYTVVTNDIFNHTEISAEARFTWCYLFSKPDGWNVNMKDVQRMLGCGRDKTLRIIQELKGADWLSYERHNSGGGTYTLHEITTVGFSDIEKPTIEKPDHIVNTERAVNTERNLLVKTAFDRWWSEYPKKKAKEAALKAFKTAVNLKTAEKVESFADFLIADTKNRAVNCAQWVKDDGRYIPNGATYLNGKRFKDEITKIREEDKRVKLPYDDAALAEFAVSNGLHERGCAPQNIQNNYQYRAWIQERLGT